MKKTLVLAALAIVGALTASAQSNVYSLNIVGYVNAVINPTPTAGQFGFTLLANPLDNGAGNLASNLVPANLPALSRVYTYDPSAGYGFVFKKTTGAWSANPAIPPGAAFFVAHTNQSAFTNTFVGNVAGSVPGSLTNNLSFGTTLFNLTGSMYPIGGGVTNTGSNTINLPTLPIGSRVYTYDTTNGYGFTFKKTTGAWSANPNINVGQGFFINNPSNTAVQWIQNVGP